MMMTMMMASIVMTTKVDDYIDDDNGDDDDDDDDTLFHLALDLWRNFEIREAIESTDIAPMALLSPSLVSFREFDDGDVDDDNEDDK